MSRRGRAGLWALLWVGMALMVCAQMGALGAWQAAHGGARDHIAATAPRDSLSALTLDDVRKLREALGGAAVSWWAAAQQQVSTERAQAQAQVIACDGGFADAHPVPMLSGSFLPLAGGSAAVLSADVAWQLFGTVNAVGMTVRCDGRDYEVCGVSAPREGLLGALCGGDGPTVYVSGAEIIASGAMKIGGLDALMERAPGGQSLQAVQAALAGLGVGGDWLLEDLGEQAGLQDQLIRVPTAALAVSVAVLLALFWVRVARGAVAHARQTLARLYFSQAWPALLGQAVGTAVLLALCAGVAAALWAGAGLRVSLPGRYLPDSWIDLGFYGALVESEAARQLAAWGYERPWWALLRVRSNGLGVWLTAAAGAGAALAALTMAQMHARQAFCAARGEPGRGMLDVPMLGLGLALAVGVGLLALGWAQLPGAALAGTLGVDAAALCLWLLWPRRGALCDWLAALGSRIEPHKRYGIRANIQGGNR